jgi:hypothetical protein
MSPGGEHLPASLSQCCHRETENKGTRRKHAFLWRKHQDISCSLYSIVDRLSYPFHDFTPEI